MGKIGLGNMLDSDIVRLAKAIREHETGNRAIAGKSGELASRYQYMPGTWKAKAGKYLGDPQAPLTLENENKATYLQLADWKKQGYNPGQIASMWNSGKPNWQGNVGVNSKGVKYDTPSYVKNVMGKYERMKQEEAKTGTGAVLSAQAAQKFPKEVPPEVKQSLLQRIGGGLLNLGKEVTAGPRGFVSATGALAQAGGEYLAGNKEAAKKTILTESNRIGKNPTLKGIGAGLQSAALVSPMGKAGVVGKVGAGAAMGYGLDVASNIEKNKTGKEALKPGLGSTVGAGIPFASKLLGALAKYTVGKTSGVGTNVIQQALDSPKAVSEAISSYAKTPELKQSLVDTAKEGINKFLHQRGENYGQSISSMVSKKPLSKQVAIDEFAKQVDKFGGKVQGKELVFKDSQLTKTDVNDLKQAWSAISKWGDMTPQGFDRLRQGVNNYRGQFKMAGNTRADFILGKVEDSISSHIKENVPGYGKVLADYGSKTRLAKNLAKELSQSTNAKDSTQLNSVLKLFKKEPKVMEDLVKVMGKQEADKFLSELSGAILSEWLPAGTMAKLLREAGGVGLAVGAAKGLVAAPAAVAGVAAMSPRIVGKGATTAGRILKSKLPAAAKKVLTIKAANKK